MKTNNTKKRFLLSVIAVIACVAMLVGTTMAWFTDSVTSGKNKIVAGNLDIELEYTTDGTNWSPVTKDTKLFKDKALWEPGYTEVAYLRLSNKGNLALKYNLGVNVENEVEGTNVAGETFKLSNYINMGVVEDWNGTVYADRAAARSAVTAAAPIANYSKSGSMQKGADSEMIAIVVYMPETVGNEANPKTGTTPPSINLGVSVVATQLNSERDSFDDTYDFNAKYPDGSSSPVITVGSAESLKEAILQFVGGKSIVLDKDIDLKNENWDTITPWAASGTELVFDGNGHTIKNLKTTGDNGGLFGKFNSNGNIVIKNLKLENVDLAGTNIDGESGGGALIGWSEVYGGTLTIENVSAINVKIKDFKYIGGLIGYTSTTNNLNIKNCSVNCSVNNESVLNSTYNESGNYKGHVGGLIGYYTKGTMLGCSANSLTILGSTTAGRAGALIGTAQKDVVVGTGNSVHSVTLNGTKVTETNQVIGSVDNRTDKTTNVEID